MIGGYVRNLHSVSLRR
ncbi:BnaA02g11460D [Brassica napus]|uniref:BnaA02g11460D protein n=1 Tax=Brassica napus TaxID=3708 RepID=A0A078FU30_BRANA|nr:BnaA02g11460D [Brassica napus]